MRVGARRGQADIQVSSVAFLGLDGRGNAVDKVHGGVRARFENLEREMVVGTYLQFLNSQGPLDKIKFSLSSGAQIIQIPILLPTPGSSHTNSSMFLCY